MVEHATHMPVYAGPNIVDYHDELIQVMFSKWSEIN